MAYEIENLPVIFAVLIAIIIGVVALYYLWWEPRKEGYHPPPIGAGI